MKKNIALFLVISFILMNCASYDRGEGLSLEPGQKPGAKLIIQKNDNLQIEAELIAVAEDSLLLKDSSSGADVTVAVNDIKIIIIRKKSQTLGGVGAGLLVGGVIGFLAGYIPSNSKGNPWLKSKMYSKSYAKLPGFLTFNN